MKEIVKVTLYRCYSVAQADEAWKFWGYKKYPKHGSIINMFRAQWRVDLEIKLFAEIIISNAAAYVAGGALNANDIDEFAQFFTDKPEVGACIGYSSSYQLREDILKYAKAPPDEWPNIVSKRLPLNNIADTKLLAGVVMGCAQYARFASTAINLVKQSTNSGQC